MVYTDFLSELDTDLRQFVHIEIQEIYEHIIYVI